MEEAKFTSSCQVNDEFSETNYQPSVDGVFTFKIRDNVDQALLDQVQGLLIEMAGSFIPFEDSISL
jgi:hypothetical protein